MFEFWQNLVAEMAAAGFRGAGFAECGDGDDPGGGIVAAVIFSAVPKTLGNGMRKIIRIYLKAPGEKWWVLAARIEEGESGPVSEVQYTAPLLAKPLVEAIRKAQRSPIP